MLYGQYTKERWNPSYGSMEDASSRMTSLNRKMYLGYISSPISPECQNLAIEVQTCCIVNIMPVPPITTKRKRGEENLIIVDKRKKRKFIPTPRLNSLTGEEKPIVRDVRKKMNTKYRLYCQHCKAEFYSKATYRVKYQHHLVNHRCFNHTRMQYVVGVRHRRCTKNCNPELGCIRFVSSPSQK